MNYTSTMQTKTNRRSLPKGWQWVKFGDVIAESQSGFASGQRDSNGIIQLRMNNVDTRGNLLWNEFIRVPANQAIIEKYRLKPGDIVFNNTNSTELVGKSALFSNHEEVIVYSNHFTRLRVKPDIADAGFVTHWLISQWRAKTFEKICNRWIGQSAVKTDKLFALEIPLPPLDEQRRIASRLNEQLAAVQSARKAAEEQLQAARRLRSAYLREAFTNDEAGRWKIEKLGDLSTQITDGPHVTPKYQEQGIPFITVRNIVNRRIDLTNVRYISLEDHIEFCKRVKAEKGDILYTKDGTLGIPCVVDTDLDFSFFVSVAVIKLMRDKLNPFFVAYALESPQVLAQVEELGAGMGLKHMVIKSIKALEIPVPSLADQERIASGIISKLDNATKITEMLESQLAEIKRLPASLLRKAFEGGG
jgi:type I restriction enzyme S subunit